MAIRKLNDNEIRCLRKIFITWLKKKGFYNDYIEAKMYLKIHYKSPNEDGWPHNLNESGLYYFFSDYCNLIDRTIDYYRCKHIRKDWSRINKKWRDFAYKHEQLLMNCFFKTKS